MLSPETRSAIATHEPPSEAPAAPRAARRAPPAPTPTPTTPEAAHVLEDARPTSPIDLAREHLRQRTHERDAHLLLAPVGS